MAVRTYLRQLHDSPGAEIITRDQYEAAAAVNVYDVALAVEHGFSSPGARYWTERD